MPSNKQQENQCETIGSRSRGTGITPKYLGGYDVGIGWVFLRLAGVVAGPGRCVGVDVVARVEVVLDPVAVTELVGPVGAGLGGVRGWTAGVAFVALVAFA
jgi:hypothetical protein